MVQRAIHGIVQRLVQEYQPERIILFGSYAYGQPHEGSDLDLLIVKDTSWKSYWDEYRRVENIIGDLRRSLPTLDIKLRTPAQLRARLELEDDFYIEIIQRGKVLYESPQAPPLDIEQIIKGSKMTTEERRLRRAGEWLRKAGRDMRMLSMGLEDPDLAEPSAFHLQQAVEKYLKAYLIRNGWRLQRVHDLEKLLNEAIRFDDEFRRFVEVCKKITGWYIEVRYPTDEDEEEAPPLPPPPPPTIEEVKQALAEIEPLLEKIRQSIKSR